MPEALSRRGLLVQGGSGLALAGAGSAGLAPSARAEEFD